MAFFEHKIEVFPGKNDEWYWRARHHRTSKIVADGSQGYSTASNARRAARRIGRALAIAPVQTLKGASRSA